MVLVTALLLLRLFLRLLPLAPCLAFGRNGLEEAGVRHGLRSHCDCFWLDSANCDCDPIPWLLWLAEEAAGGEGSFFNGVKGTYYQNFVWLNLSFPTLQTESGG